MTGVHINVVQWENVRCCDDTLAFNQAKTFTVTVTMTKSRATAAKSVTPCCL